MTSVLCSKEGTEGDCTKEQDDASSECNLLFQLKSFAVAEG